METKKVIDALQSKNYKKIVGILLILIIVLTIFNVGMRVGYMKALFANEAGENYYRPMGKKNPEHKSNFIRDESFDAHGASGKIISITLPTFVVADQSGVEKIIHIENETIIRKMREAISPEFLQVGNVVVVIGEPNAGAEVDAKLIRVVPQLK